MKPSYLLKSCLAASLLLTAGAAHAQTVLLDTTLDNSGSPLVTTTSTSYNLGSLTVANNANRMLVIAIGSGRDNGTDPALDISSISYGSQNFTRQVGAAQGNNARWSNEIWTLASPDAGASQTLTLTMASSRTDSFDISWAAMSFHNVDLADPFLDTVEQNTNADPVVLNYNFGSTVTPMYVEAISANDGGSSGGTPPTGFNSLINEDNGELSVVLGYQSVTGESGAVARSFDSSGPNSYSGSGIALAAIPEPSTALLLASSLGLVFLGSRRRRARA